TLLEMLGREVPGGAVDGYSWCDRLSGHGELAEPDVFIEWHGQHHSPGWSMQTVRDRIGQEATEVAPVERIAESLTDPVRTIISPDGWKFNCSPLGEHELYNLDQDPQELDNLFGTPGTTEVVRSLRDRLAAWQQRAGDDVALPSF
ncbi:MAG: hypothetical protein ACOCXX_01680, partial [Planctomycetota bacterium]